MGDVKAAADIAAGLEASSPTFGSLARVANIKEQEGDLPAALAAMKSACDRAERERLTPVARAWAQVRVGLLYLSSCDPGEAEKAYDRALQHLPGYYLALEHRAELRTAQGRLAEAIALYRRLLDSRDSADYQLALAELYARVGDTDAASRFRQLGLAALRAAAEAGDRTTWPSLAARLVEAPGSAPEAVAWAEKDWENRRDFMAADALAWARYKNRLLSEAERIIAPLIEAGCKAPRVLFHAGMIYLETGRIAPGRRLLRQAMECPLSLDAAEKEEARRALARAGE